jgi:hypothetical protein
VPAPTLEQLAQDYLVTPDGNGPDNPCGWSGQCNAVAYNTWRAMVMRIRGALLQTLKINKGKGITYDSALAQQVASFVGRTTRLRKAPWYSAFGMENSATVVVVGIAKSGVGILHQVQTAVSEGGGTNISPGPLEAKTPDVGLPGNDLYWFGGAAVAVLILYMLYRR